MLKTLIKAAVLLACLAWFNFASAANMGGINITSSLGHPLSAEISLAEFRKTDKSTLVARMASVNEFKAAGLDYPYSLPKLKFEVETRANGDAYIKLTSTQPVNEPFVSLLIELSWQSGKLLREYTFLLDPAGFTPEQPKLAEVKPVEPTVPIQLAEPDVIPVPAVTPAEAPAPFMSDMAKAQLAATELERAEQVSVASGKVLPAEPAKMQPLSPSPQAMAGAVSILVGKGDTLAKIADDVKPVDVSLERMLVAMYRANAKSFGGNNMNRIKAGKILRMPDSVEIARLTQAAAVKEIRAQVADWQDYRQKLAAVQSISAERAPKQEAAGKISAAVAEKAPAVKESAKEILKLSKGESLGDKTVAGSATKSKQEKLTAEADDAAARSKQLQEDKKNIVKLEELNKNASKLVELKGLPVQPKIEDLQTPASIPGLAAVSAVPVTEPVAAELDIMAMINEYLAILLENPLLLGAAVAVLLGLGSLGSIRARRSSGGQKKNIHQNDGVNAYAGSLRTPVTPSADTGDFTHSAAPSAAALDDVDPISEADLFLNFGRDAQAEEILKDALSKKPSSIQVKLKLLSIYMNRKDRKSFSKYAQEIQDSGDVAAWERAAVMGREVDASNPIYAGVKGEVRNRVAPKAEVDFDLGFGQSAAPVAGNAVAAKDFKMNFDLSAAQSDVPSKSVDLNTLFAKSSAVSKAKLSADVDATSILSRADVQSAQTASPMDFDVSGIFTNDVKNIAQSTTMDFDVSGSFGSTSVIPEPSPHFASASSAMNLDDLVFDIPTSQSKPVPEKAKATEKAKAAADEGMAFTIDFPTSGNIESPSGKPATANKLDIDFGAININLDEDVPSVRAGGEGKDEQWHEVATKLDLAKAYQEMGDADGAREILEEVIRDGDDTQREAGEKLRQQIAA